jgi:metal-responsive CopG/Arc/MetJ family transcriptional regulator
MGNAVKKTISLPPKLAKEVEDISREEGKIGYYRPVVTLSFS